MLDDEITTPSPMFISPFQHSVFPIPYTPFSLHTSRLTPLAPAIPQPWRLPFSHALSTIQNCFNTIYGGIMIDYQRVIEYLRDFRLQPNKHATEDVRRYATEYAELCKQANDRLPAMLPVPGAGAALRSHSPGRRTAQSIGLGGRWILPEPDAWAEFCQQADLPVPLPLQMDRAAQLNEAYAQDQPLEHLLNRHRLLALSRASVAERLDVLRQISAQDPGGTLWEKSIRTFEKARRANCRQLFWRR